MKLTLLHLKKSLKVLVIFIGSFVAFIAIYLAFAFILSRITVDEEIAENKNVTMYILTNGVHTDLVFPTTNEYHNWLNDVNHLDTTFNITDHKYLAFGWGDKGFYLETPTWDDLKFSVAFNAVFGLSSSAMHATFYPELIENESCKKIMISKEQYLRFVEFISKSFTRTENGKVIQIETDANYGETDAFYEANGTYNLFNTCNSWANRGLKVGGQRACLWTAFQEGIFLKYN